MTALYGVTVCAEADDGVGRPTVPPPAAPLSFLEYPQHPNFVIPRAVAESISPQPTHQPENPAPSALHHGYCDFAQHDGVVWGDGVCGGG